MTCAAQQPSIAPSREAQGIVSSGGFSPCPHCGNRCLVLTTEVRGVWTSLITIKPDGTHEVEGCNDDVRTVRQPKTVRCDKCKRRLPNPFLG